MVARKKKRPPPANYAKVSDRLADYIREVEHDHGHDNEGLIDPDFDEFFPGEGLHVTLDDSSD